MNGIYKYLSAFFAIGVVLQIGLAGYGAFYAAHKSDDNTPKVITHDSFEHGFGHHGSIGVTWVFFRAGLVGKLPVRMAWVTGVGV